MTENETIPIDLPPEHRAVLNDPPEFTDEQRVYLEALLAFECCHMTGMHDPKHWMEDGTVCWEGMEKPYKRILEELGLEAPVYSAHDCGRCRGGYAEGEESPFDDEFPTYSPQSGQPNESEGEE